MRQIQRPIDPKQMGYRIVPLPNWGAAESIAIDPVTQKRYGLHDSRKLTGEAMVQ